MAPKIICIIIVSTLLTLACCTTATTTTVRSTSTQLSNSVPINPDIKTTDHQTTTDHPNDIDDDGHVITPDHVTTSKLHSDKSTVQHTTGHGPDDHTEDGGSEYSSDHGSGTIVLVPVHFSHVKYPLVFTLVVIVCSLFKLVFHFSHFLSARVPESCMLIILGLIIGGILNATGVSETLTLYSPHEFFLFLLPPIVLEAAFSLHDRTFADNVGGVLLYAVVGTILNCFSIGFTLFGLYKVGAMEEINCSLVQILVFSSLIVAVDPVAVLAVFQEVGVNSTLYFLVFGESLLNDGVTVVLYNVLQTFNRMDDVEVGDVFMGVLKFVIVCCGGVTLGIIMALLSAFITRFTNEVKVVEPLVIFGFAYLSYVLSELFEFSGIISMTVCGIIQVHYSFQNITNKSRITIKFIAKVMANATEIVIFMFLGVVTITPDHDWKTGFTLWTAFLCISFRFFFTYCLSFCINHFSHSRVRKIKVDEMFMISYGGLRGAVCFSLVALIDEGEIPMKKMFVTTSLFVIFLTVFIQGGTIKGLVKKLRITLAETNKDMNLNEELSSHVFDHVMAGVEEILGYTTGTHHLKEKLDQLDDKFVKPKLLRRATKSDLSDISTYYEKLVMKEHFKNLQLGGAKGLPRVKTEIRSLDSELALDQLVQDVDERNAHDRHDEISSFRDHEVMTRNHSLGDNVHKFLSHTLHTVRSRMHLHVRDKNLVHDHKHQLVTHLRRKHKKNNQLSAIKKRREEEEETEEEQEPTKITIEDSIARRTSQVTFQLHDTVIEEQELPREHDKVTFEL